MTVEEIRDLLVVSESNARSTASIPDPDGIDALRKAVAGLVDLVAELVAVPVLA